MQKRSVFTIFTASLLSLCLSHSALAQNYESISNRKTKKAVSGGVAVAGVAGIVGATRQGKKIDAREKELMKTIRQLLQQPEPLSPQIMSKLRNAEVIIMDGTTEVERLTLNSNEALKYFEDARLEIAKNPQGKYIKSIRTARMMKANRSALILASVSGLALVIGGLNTTGTHSIARDYAEAIEFEDIELDYDYVESFNDLNTLATAEDEGLVVE